MPMQLIPPSQPGPDVLPCATQWPTETLPVNSVMQRDRPGTLGEQAHAERRGIYKDNWESVAGEPLPSHPYA